jgi:hypothetical protein
MTFFKRHFLPSTAKEDPPDPPLSVRNGGLPGVLPSTAAAADPPKRAQKWWISGGRGGCLNRREVPHCLKVARNDGDGNVARGGATDVWTCNPAADLCGEALI